jgi:tRNA-dihydrouridine synthase
MIDLNPLLSLSWQSWNSVDTYEIPGQRQWIQLIVNNSDRLAKFPGKLRQFQEQFPDRANFFGININAGCPGPNIIQAGQGAALIKRSSRLVQLIRAFLGPKESHDFKINVKLRLGLNNWEMRENVYLETLERIHAIDDPRVYPSIVHFKHAEQTSAEPERWELLETILDSNMPIIINGGLETPKQMEQLRNRVPRRLRTSIGMKNVVGIMIGRAAIKNPDIFLAFLPPEQRNSYLNGEPGEKRLQYNLRIHPPESRFVEFFASQIFNPKGNS